MTENSKEEQIAKRKAAASEFSNDLATLPKMYQCTKKPHRPIFPVRHSLRPSFIASNTEQKSLGIEPKGLNMTNTHWLETVRQGFIYIYAPDGHQGDTASDINKKWMVFRYNTDVNDINSKISYKFIDTENKEGYPHFIKYRFENQNSSTQLGTTSDNWKREGVYPAPFIHDDTSEVYIAYSEYPWTPALFEKIESDDTELRDIIMTKVNPVPLNKKTEKPKYALPQEQVNLLKEIDNYVINFSLQSHKQNAIDEFKKKDLAAINLQRYTKILPATVTFCTDELEKGLFVVLTDTLGEIRELQSQHILLADKRGRYLSDYRYPMTIGSVIDPHLALSVRGKTPPNEPTIRKKLIAAYEESEKSWFGAKKEFALVSSFEDEYKKLLQDDFDKHFKPITAVLSNLRLLRERQSLTKLLLQLEIDSKKAATDNNKVKTCIVSTGNYLSIVSDCLYSLQESEQGWLELTNLFEGKNNTESKQDKNKNKNKDKDKDKVAFPEIPKWIDILDKVNELSETFEEAPAAGFILYMQVLTVFLFH
ncbi:MAG: hypothetical protein CR960_01345 [Pasteurellales bacterium]|nr:MAG: hypothetical protein CR960_01345 [Pasteurellales bacterium]